MTIWIAPQAGEVERTLSAVGEPALRRLFFQELENPEWLAPLASLGVFSDPGVVETDEGVTAWPWPEGDYLRRVADEHPQEVAALLQRLTDSENPWVVRTLVDIAAALPVADLVKLVPGIAGIVRRGASRVDESRLAVIVERLLEADERKQARKLMDALFGPVSGGEEEMAFGTRTRIASSIDDYWYKELLGRLTSKIADLGIEGLKLSTGWLMRAVEIVTDGEEAQSMGIWRPSIEASDQNTGLYDIDDALVDLVRDVAASVSHDLASCEAVDFLNSRDDFLVRRIAVGLVATLAGSETCPEDVLAAGVAMLMDASLLDIDARPEYARLAESVAPRLSQTEADDWASFLLDGRWLPSEDRLRRMAAWAEGDPDAITDDDISKEKRRLVHRLLSGFSSVLSGRLADAFDELETEFGPVDHPRFSSYVESFTGPTSPLSAAELENMSTEEVLAYLREWTPDHMGSFGPSVEGLGRVLEGVVQQRPERYAELQIDLLSLKPTYARSIVEGWAKAVKNGYRPSRELWATLTRLARHERDERIADAQVNFDDDPRWRIAHGSLVRLATAIADVEQDWAQLQAAWHVLLPLTSHEDPTPEHEARYGGTNMDSLTLSLNTVRPAAIRGAMHILSALRRLEGADVSNEEVNQLRAEVLETLAAHVGPEADPSLAVAAAFGEGFGRLWNADESWVEHHQPALVEAAAQQRIEAREWADVVVSVALRSYAPNPAVLRMLRPALAVVLSRQYAQVTHLDGWRERRTAVENAGTQVIWCLGLGTISLDDPLVEELFSGSVSVEALSESLGHHGWQLTQIKGNADPEDPPAEFLERSRSLIEWRLEEARRGHGSFAELQQFHWWIKSGAFEASWWLPILDEVTAAEVVLDKTFLGEALAEASKTDAATTIRVFDRLIAVGEYWQRYDLIRHAPPIVAAALTTEDRTSRGLARSLMDRFAREGNLDVVAEIQRLAEPGPA